MELSVLSAANLELRPPAGADNSKYAALDGDNSPSATLNMPETPNLPHPSG